jgi:hypothetical protein
MGLPGKYCYFTANFVDVTDRHLGYYTTSLRSISSAIYLQKIYQDISAVLFSINLDLTEFTLIDILLPAGEKIKGPRYKKKF